MVHRLLLAALGRRELDDRDHYGNKRLDLAGPLLAFLFRGWGFFHDWKKLHTALLCIEYDIKVYICDFDVNWLPISMFSMFKNLLKEIRIYAQKFIDRGKDFNLELAIKTRIISDGLKYSLATGNWGDVKKAHQARAGVSQVRTPGGPSSHGWEGWTCNQPWGVNVLRWFSSCSPSLLVGVEPSDLRLHSVSPPPTQLSHRQRRKTGKTPTAPQHAVGDGVSGRDARGKELRSLKYVERPTVNMVGWWGRWSESVGPCHWWVKSFISGSRRGTGEELGPHGLHLCGLSAVSHPGVSGGVEYGELGGNLTRCHCRVSHFIFSLNCFGFCDISLRCFTAVMRKVSSFFNSFFCYHCISVRMRVVGWNKTINYYSVSWIIKHSKCHWTLKVAKWPFMCLYCFSATKIFVNGCWVGIHKDPEQLMNTLRKLRRQMDIIVSEVCKQNANHTEPQAHTEWDGRKRLYINPAMVTRYQ